MLPKGWNEIITSIVTHSNANIKGCNHLLVLKKLQTTSLSTKNGIK